MMVLGELPNKSLRARSIGRVPLRLDSKTKRLSPVTSPTTYMGARSRSAICRKRSSLSGGTISPMRSCDSLPMISFMESVGSPMGS